MAISRDKRLERAQMKVLFQVPFFAPGVAKLPVVWDDSIPTACTDGQVIRWSTKFFDALEDQELVTLLCHEVAHCMLGHLWRIPGTVQGQDGVELWNEAADHAVNLMLKEFSELVMGKRLADPFPFPKKFPPLADPAFKGLSEEVIFSRINRPGGGGGGGKGKGTFGQFVPGGAGNGTPGAGQTPAQQKALASDWAGTLVNAANMSKGRGDLPAGMDRFVEELVNPSLSWWEILRSFLREQCSDDWDFLKPAMEWEGSGFILPSLHSERVGTVVFATDTSGSIDHAILAQFQAEKQNCVDEMKPKRVIDIYCDSKIQKVGEYSAGEAIDRHAPGGGGTSFVPVFEHCAKMSDAPKALVYLTDLDGRFPKEAPPYPVLWVTWTKDGTAPFGEVIYAPES